MVLDLCSEPGSFMASVPERRKVMKETYEEAKIVIIAVNRSNVVLTSDGTGLEFSYDLPED